MKTVKVKTNKEIARVMKNSFANWADVCLMKDENGYYLLGFVHMSFPSSNNDEIVARFNEIGRWGEKQIAESLEIDYQFQLSEPIVIIIHI